LSARENLDSLGRKQARMAPAELGFADPAHRGREAFLRSVLDRLAREHWQHRPDAGWGAWDVEVYGSRWSKLRLLTVSEHTDDGVLRLRCRLRTHWTLPAKLGFGMLLGAALIAAALLRGHGWFAWSPVAAPALVAYAFSRNQRDLRRVLAVFLEEVAESLGLRPDPAPPSRTSPDGPASAN
jgi:hypothetical protein